MLRIELPGKRKQGRPRRRYMDVVREDMAGVKVTEEDAGPNGDGKCAVATHDGRSNKRNHSTLHLP